jgi:hypothetical protein
MTPVNNSDTAWLIVSDYNQDNGLPYECLREDVLNPDISQWTFEWRLYNGGRNTTGDCDAVGGTSIGYSSVGAPHSVVGEISSVGNGSVESTLVGGN